MGDLYCFGCSQTNPKGLHLEVHPEGDQMVAFFTPTIEHSGWQNIVHGGLICTVMDELTGWVTHALGQPCVTAKLETHFDAPVHVGERVRAQAKAIHVTRRLITVEAQVIGAEDGRLRAHATATMVVVTPQKAEKYDIDTTLTQ